MKITEFFKSIDGEGIRTGRIVTFIRGFGCCCNCSYCDSKYSNEVTEGVEIKTMSVEDIVKKCLEYKTPYITLTGGEPLIQKDIVDVIVALLMEGFEVNIETSGAVDIVSIRDKVYKLCPNVPKEKLIFTVDYKSISSGCNNMMIMTNFVSLNNWDVIKFVVGNEEDMQDMKKLVLELERVYKSERLPHIFVSPIFGMIDPKDMVQFTINNDLFNVRTQLQLHKCIWDSNMRGV